MSKMSGKRKDFVVSLELVGMRKKCTKTFVDRDEATLCKKMSGEKSGSKGLTLDFDVLLEQAKEHLQTGDLRGAEYSLLHIAKRDPTNIPAKLLLAKIMLSQALLYKAEKLYEEVLKQDAENVEGLEDYGVFLGKHVKEYELAEQVLQLAVKAS
eukprot:CAMPEP_0179412868 /NCGR_PEP_ID=MMETSP0799-20121207/4725_1 /TAXON_ID=46947 /ORGANISM="Geminigera cryophila, Strain CCMP2564" /LENGTH=153 /DNA_ID=CAMNT_0021185163 /DNA_START=18 /DNA_END=476 /DNA_ORIENTATION=+